MQAGLQVGPLTTVALQLFAGVPPLALLLHAVQAQSVHMKPSEVVVSPAEQLVTPWSEQDFLQFGYEGLFVALIDAQVVEAGHDAAQVLALAPDAHHCVPVAQQWPLEHVLPLGHVPFVIVVLHVQPEVSASVQVGVAGSLQPEHTEWAVPVLVVL